MAFYDKDKEYLNNLYKSYSNIEEFREFEKNFDGFSEEEIARMYTVKKSNEVKDFQNNTDIDIIDKVETLEYIGDFFDKTGKLDELIELQNQEIIKKIGRDIGSTEERNPFLLNKEEVLKNFDIETTLDKSEENINVKLAFWVNRFTKELESVKRSNIQKIASDKNLSPNKVKNKLNNIEDKIVINNPNYYNQYKKFLNQEITKEEFEKTEEFNKMKVLSMKTKYNTYELFDIASLDNNIAIGYIEKSFIIKDMALQKNNLEIKSFEDPNIKGNFKVVNVKSQDKFNGILSLHLKNTEAKILEESKGSKIERGQGSGKYNTITTYILNEYSDEKINRIKGIMRRENSYGERTKKILNEYKDLLGIKYKNIQKNQTKRSKKLENLKNRFVTNDSNENKLLKELKNKVNKNPEYKHENNKNDRDLNLDREDR